MEEEEEEEEEEDGVVLVMLLVEDEDLRGVAVTAEAAASVVFAVAPAVAVIATNASPPNRSGNTPAACK